MKWFTMQTQYSYNNNNTMRENKISRQKIITDNKTILNSQLVLWVYITIKMYNHIYA